MSMNIEMVVERLIGRGLRRVFWPANTSHVVDEDFWLHLNTTTRQFNAFTCCMHGEVVRVSLHTFIHSYVVTVVTRTGDVVAEYEIGFNDRRTFLDLQARGENTPMDSVVYDTFLKLAKPLSVTLQWDIPN